MTTQQILLCSTALAVTLLAGCSQTKSLTKFGSQNKSIAEDSALVVPPSLKMPSGTSSSTSAMTSTKQTHRPSTSPVSRPKITKSVANPNAKNYYVVVGTYPSQEEAMDTFIRLSSIGLPNSTMETRTTKSGKRLHMVRLGPFQDQAKIDKVKDSLISDGLSQFKVVEN